MSAPEDLPVMRLRVEGGGDIEATPLNTQLFNFIGRTLFRGMEVDADKFDHIFIQHNDRDAETARGNFIFREQPFEEEPNPVYLQMADFMIEADYPLRLNQREVPDCDKSAYEQLEDQAIGYEAGKLPDDFNLGDWDGTE